MFDYRDTMKNNAKFDVLMCIESGDGFEKGCLYAGIGTNNGINVLRVNGQHEPESFVYRTAGNYAESWDGNAKPAFLPVHFGNYER